MGRQSQVFEVARAARDDSAPAPGEARLTGRRSPATTAGASRAKAAWVLIVPLLTFLLVTLASSPAQAHNVLTGSDPKGGTTLPVLPGRVTLTFDQSVRRDFARIAVTGPDGAHY